MGNMFKEGPDRKDSHRFRSLMTEQGGKCSTKSLGNFNRKADKAGGHCGHPDRQNRCAVRNHAEMHIPSETHKVCQGNA